MSAAKQAHEFLEEGDKFSKTTLFRWSPDYMRASTAYVEASKKFQVLGEAFLEQYAKACERAGYCFEELNSLNTAAKYFSYAAVALDKLGRNEKCIQCFHRSKELYLANGQVGMAAGQLEKAAKASRNVNESMALYMEAVDIFLDNEKATLSHDMFKLAISFAVRNEKFAEAIKLLNKQNRVLLDANKPLRMNKNYLAIIVIMLSLGQDREAGDAILGFAGEFIGSEEHGIAEALITAFEEQDAEKLEIAKSKPSLRLIETQVAKLVKTLEIKNVDGAFLRTKHKTADLSEDEEDEIDLT